MPPWVPIPPTANEPWVTEPSNNDITAFQPDAFQAVELAFQIGLTENWTPLPPSGPETWAALPVGAPEPWTPLPAGTDEIWT